MTPAFRYSLLWIVGASIIVVAALSMLSAAYIDGQYLPSNPDAFYHARRVLDVVMTGQPVIEFDNKIHVPEGSWITWPWAYDSALAHITRWFGPFADEAAANRVLMKIPVVAGVVAVSLVLLSALLLRLSFALSCLLVIGFSLLPVVQGAYAVGNIDHHFAESMWTTMSICAGMWFFAKPAKKLPGIVLGLVLGTGLGIHNSLFILQLPVIAMLAWRWLRSEPLPSRRAIVAFAAGLVVATIAICAPSQPLQQGFFEFYTLSWFHAYISFCTAAFALLLSFLPRKPANIGWLGAASLLAALPIVSSLGLAGSFVSGELESISNVVEAQSPYELYQRYGSIVSTTLYSWLLWLALPAAVFNGFLVVRSADARLQFFGMAGVVGLVLLMLQYRFHVFGEFALIATPLLAAHLAMGRWPSHMRKILLGTAVGLALALVPTKTSWRIRYVPAAYAGFEQLRGAFPVLRDACSRNPGVTLASFDAGHWVRYFSQCSVIGDAFLLTAQHQRKFKELQQLLSLKPAQVMAANKSIKYVFVHHDVSVYPGRDEPNLEQLRVRKPVLIATLLGTKNDIPQQYKLLWEGITPAGQTFSRLYEIVRE